MQQDYWYRYFRAVCDISTLRVLGIEWKGNSETDLPVENVRGRLEPGPLVVFLQHAWREVSYRRIRAVAAAGCGARGASQMATG